jgi:L-malate glycosyltransferase
MKVLIITNMSPSKDKPYADVFVKGQVEMLRDLGGKWTVIDYFYTRDFKSGMVGTLLKYLFAFMRFTPYLLKRYDVVHLHYFYPLSILLVLYKLVHPKTVLATTFHGSDINKNISGSAKIWLFRAIALRFGYFIAVGEEIKDVVKAKLGILVDRVLCAGIDEQIFNKDLSTKKEYDFLFVGNLLKSKGVQYLVEASRSEGLSGYRYCVVGNGPLANDVRKATISVNFSWFEGRNHHQLAELYRRSKFLVLPSESEGFGLVSSESLFCGTPVIVSCRGGLIDQVTEGENGFFFPELSASCVLETLEHAGAMSEKEYGRMVKNVNGNKDYSLGKVCKTIFEDYESLIIGIE